MYQQKVEERPVFMPAVDIHETEEGLTLWADLPGVRPESLEIFVENNVLQIYGRTRLPIPEDAEPVQEEYRSGDYYRCFILSDDYDTSRLQARMESGVLRLHLPR